MTGGGEITFKQELARKATHMGALSIPGGYYLLQLDKTTALTIMIPIALAMVLLDVSRLRGWPLWTRVAGRVISPMIRSHEENGDFTGATYILITACLTIALYDKPVAIAALAFIVVGDSFAAVFGRRFGRHKWFRNKSIEGSTACLVGTILVALFTPGLPTSVAFFGALAAAAVETLPLGVDDNVSVPILSGLAMTLLGKSLTYF
jgi:dolichol kinase